MKTKPSHVTPRVKREPRWKLSELNCTDLAVLVMLPPSEGMESEFNARLRCRYKHPDQLAKLKLCGALSAVHHAAHVRTAARLQVVPTIVLTATGGRPKASSMPRYDRALVRMGAQHGLVIHRMDDGAFIMARNPPKAPPVEAVLCSGEFQLDPH